MLSEYFNFIKSLHKNMSFIELSNKLSKNNFIIIGIYLKKKRFISDENVNLFRMYLKS